MWYAIQVFTGKEQETIDLCYKYIPDSSYELINPRMERLRQYGGRWHKEQAVMFPGYIFISTEDIIAFQTNSRQVPRVLKVLGDDMEPIPLQREEEEMLRRLVNDEYVLELSTGIKNGDTLSIKSGSLIGMEALIKKINRHKRQATIQVPMFGRTVETVVGLEVLVDVHQKS